MLNNINIRGERKYVFFCFSYTQFSLHPRYGIISFQFLNFIGDPELMIKSISSGIEQKDKKFKIKKRLRK